MKIFTGTVISTKMAKTATVVVERVTVHPIYKKRIKRNKKYHVHDELGVNVGEKVKFVASRPYSKLKKWKIIEVVADENKARKASTKKSSNRKKSSDKQTRKGAMRKRSAKK